MACNMMEEPLLTAGAVGKIEAVKAWLTSNRTAVELLVPGGVNPSVTRAQYSTLAVGAKKVKMTDVLVMPVTVPATVVSKEQVLLVPL